MIIQISLLHSFYIYLQRSIHKNETCVNPKNSSPNVLQTIATTTLPTAPNFQAKVGSQFSLTKPPHLAKREGLTSFLGKT